MRFRRVCFIGGLGILFGIGAHAQGVDLKLQLYTYSQAIGAGSKVGVICQMSAQAAMVQTLMVSSKAYKLELMFYDAKSAVDIEKGFTSLQAKGINAILVIPDAVVGSKTGVGILANKCKAARIPLFAASADMLAAGATATVIKTGDGSLKLLVNKASTIQFKPEVQSKIQVQ